MWNYARPDLDEARKEKEWGESATCWACGWGCGEWGSCRGDTGGSHPWAHMVAALGGHTGPGAGMGECAELTEVPDQVTRHLSECGSIKIRLPGRRALRRNNMWRGVGLFAVAQLFN